MKSLVAGLSAGLFLASAGVAAAAPAMVTGDLNLRAGPGTGYAVINTMPAGATVNVLGCSGSWCRVAWGGSRGFASRSYLDRAGPVYAAEPPPVVVGPPPVVGFGFGWGGGWHGGYHHHHRGWHHRR